MQDATPLIQVACGVLVNAQGEVLIAQRPVGKVAAGKWEFPGGKLEPGELARDALVRELEEELGIQVIESDPLIRFRYDYADRSVMLDTHRVTAWRGTPESREGQSFLWRRPEALADLDVLPTVDPILTALRLPAHYVFTPVEIKPEALLNGLPKLPAGALLRLRQPYLDEAAYVRLASEVRITCHSLGLKLILDRDPEQVARLGADGWHAREAAWKCLDKRVISSDRWFAVSVHDAAGLASARKIGADFAVLSPVAETPSHPAAPPLGWPRFAQLTEGAALPVYALGGVGPAQLAHARAHGAIGMAGIRAYWL